MSRWRAVILATVLVSGCSAPAGVDGDIADDWRPIAEAKPFVPAAGVCMPTAYAELGYLSAYHPVDCAGPHHTETAYVGMFAAGGAAPPAAGSPGRRAVYADCDRQAKAYLGDDWRTARLWLGVTVPNPKAWSGGARWYRCELAELDSVEDNGEFRQRSGSLKGALAAASAPLRLGCYTVKVEKNGQIGTMTPVACSRPHRAEFVGVHTAPDDAAYPRTEQQREAILNGCRAVLARFANVPNDAEIQYRSGTIWIPAEEDEWTAGNRGIRCYLWMDDRDLTRSLRNAGPAGLPVVSGP